MVTFMKKDCYVAFTNLPLHSFCMWYCVQITVLTLQEKETILKTQEIETIKEWNAATKVTSKCNK